MPAISIIGYAVGIASYNTGCSFGPVFLQGSDLTDIGVELEWVDMIYAHTEARGFAAVEPIAECCANVAQHTFELTQANMPFITVGGDHSCAIGTWSGAAAAKREQGPIGLIWVDAHMDSHSFDTSDSKNIHGMPVSILLGHGENALTQILDDQPKIKPENICLVGPHSFEAGEAAFLSELGVKVFCMDDIKQHGLTAVMEQAVKIACHGTSGFGISIDLDAFDPKEVPGVGYREPDGIHLPDFINSLDAVRSQPNFLGCDIAEFNPNRDENNLTLNAIKLIIQSLYG